MGLRRTNTESVGRKSLALGVLALLPILSSVIPVLDIFPDDCRDGIEDHHHPGTHGLPHNHLICIQEEVNLWSPHPDSAT